MLLLPVRWGGGVLPYIFWFLLGVIHLCLHLFPVSYSMTTKKNDNLPYTISVLISLSFRMKDESLTKTQNTVASTKCCIESRLAPELQAIAMSIPDCTAVFLLAVHLGK